MNKSLNIFKHCLHIMYALFKRKNNKLASIKKVLQVFNFSMNSGKLLNGFSLVATFENICTIMFKIKMGLTGWFQRVLSAENRNAGGILSARVSRPEAQACFFKIISTIKYFQSVINVEEQ